ELGQIMRSPAWTRQRSLAIITFDEDNFDHEHPAQKVATLVLGSRGVRQGYVSTARYTHYSLLKTIEGALGLGTLTNNDRYAAATTDVFTQHGEPWTGDSAGAAPGPVAAPALAAGAQPAPVQTSATGQAVAAASPSARPLADPTAFVVNYGLGTLAPSTVTPVNLVAPKAGRANRVGADPQAVGGTAHARTAYQARPSAG